MKNVTGTTGSGNGSRRSRRRMFQTLRARLLVSVNLIVGLGLIGFMAFDYQHQLHTRLAAHRGALADEARTLLHGVEALRHHSDGTLQEYVDAVCASMQDALSPGHHIVVQIDNSVLQSQSHHRASPQMLARILEAASAEGGRSTSDGPPLLVGSATSGDTGTYVSEFIDPILTATRQQALTRAGAIAVAGFVAALIVNLFLIRLVTRPLNALSATVRRIGAGERDVEPPTFGTEELDAIAHEIGAMSSELARRHRDRDAQLNKARRIQEHLSPKPLQTGAVQIATIYRPADAIAGDYYDVLPQDDGSVLICVADVCGHGVPAAMGAAILKTLLLGALHHVGTLAEIVRLINEQYIRVSLPEDFASLVLARVAPDGASAEYVSAGHEPGYVVGATSQLQELPSTGMLIGISRDASWDTAPITLAVSEHLVLVTDGVSEVFDAHSQLFGRRRLRAVLNAHAGSAPDAMAHALIAAADEHRGDGPRTDDQTILVLQPCLHLDTQASGAATKGGDP